MEAFEKTPPREDGDTLESFRAKIAQLKTEEAREEETAHFTELDPEDLTEEDRVLWEKLNRGDLTGEELRDYRNKVGRTGNKSQQMFVGFLGNELMRQEVRAMPHDE